jgi:protoporphyrinogen oxidase
MLVLGAGPAGLTAARELLRLGYQPTLLEKDSQVGGLSRTLEYKGFLFDVGGHRFYTTSPLVERIWRETLGEEFLTRPRLSRIYYRGKFFHYPLEPWNVVAGLGPLEVARCAASYIQSHLRPIRPERDFASWVTNRFGRRLFDTFFRTYTEKVWGIPCEQISADWAAQRIRGLSLLSLAANALRPQPGQIRTLTKTFQYPRLGPGLMWTRMAEQLRAGGARILTNSPVERIEWEPGRILGVVAGGQRYPASQVISTLALHDLIALLDPAPPPSLLNAGRNFHYRDFLIVALLLRGRDLFPDNWIYVHDPQVRVGRIQNFNNWSPALSPDPAVTSLGMEYFCSRGDALWNLPDAELIALASAELQTLGLARGAHVFDGVVLRVPRAYPVYDEHYKDALTHVRHFLQQTPNLHIAGRNGMHRYNNQDHAMLSGILAARNAAGARYDVWAVNSEGRYLEETSDDIELEWSRIESSQPLVPRHVDHPEEPPRR